MPVSRSLLVRALLGACAIAAPAHAQTEVRLKPDTTWLNYPTPGIPRTADGQPNLAAPVPARDGRPDLSGIWTSECGIYGRDECFPRRGLFFDLARDVKPEDVVMTPWAQGIATQRRNRDHVDDPVGYCLPAGVPRITFAGGPFKIIHASGVTAFFYESASGPMFRQVFTDGRPLPTQPEPSWLGYSVGRWEGNVFVIETSGFRDGGWLDTRVGRPHSDALKVTERYERRTIGAMTLTLTIDDPKAFLKPWTISVPLSLLPDTDLMESFCEGHQKTMEKRLIDPPPPEPPSPNP
jgi:hypothetical protein